MNNKNMKTIKDTNDVSGSIFYKRLCVLIETKDGKIFQAALNQEMCDTLFHNLKNYFSDGVVKILPDEIHGVTLDVAELDSR